ncbi:MAG: hypothetical protein ACPGVG_18245, partial [Mycobacterium sp.]
MANYLVYLARRVVQQQTIQFGSHSLLFVRAVLRSTGAPAMACKIDGDVPKEVSDQVRLMRSSYRFVNESDFISIDGIATDPVKAEDAPAATNRTPPAATIIDQMRESALASGWTEEELEGTGKGGHPGIEGGSSPITGLTVSLMAICAPPDSWAEKRDEHYPWELDGFQLDGFQAPQVEP